MGTITRLLLMGNKKDELDPLLVAAHFPKRIKKELVDKTNICSSVDKILVEKFPVVTYRVLGYYLIGVTRIYCKKVEYLLVDCNHSLNEMKFFSEGRKKVDVNYGGTCLPESSSQRSQLKVVDMNSSEASSRKNSYSFLESMRAQFSSLSMPNNFDLDAYDLEIVEDDGSNDHVRPHLELVLSDAGENHRTVRHTFGKDHASASTSAMITNNNPITSVEKFRNRFVLEECLDPMALGESDEELVPNSVPLTEQEQEHEQEQEREWNNDTGPTDMMSEGVQNPDKHPDEECTTTGQTMVSEMTSADNIMLKPSPNKSQLSVTINETPQSKAPVVSGERKSERVAVRTPASREHVRAPRKRKCVFDYAIVIPNEVYETWVLGASDLVRKRRTCTDILDRKEHRSFDYLMQPQASISAGFPLELRSAISANEQVMAEGEETVGPTPLNVRKSSRATTSANDQVMAEEVEEMVGPTPLNVRKSSGATTSANEQVMAEEVEETVGPTPLNVHKKSSGETEDEVIAPQTPATHPAPLRFDDVLETSMVNPMRQTRSSLSGEKVMFSITEVDFDEMRRDEGPSSLGEDNQENVLVAEKLSAVTKGVANYLHSKILQRTEKGEDEAVNLSQLLKHKTKKESARFFYQMLVLKTGGYIDVKQEKPYDDIFVKQTQKLREAFGGGSRE